MSQKKKTKKCISTHSQPAILLNTNKYIIQFTH